MVLCPQVSLGYSVTDAKVGTVYPMFVMMVRLNYPTIKQEEEEKESPRELIEIERERKTDKRTIQRRN
jgi:hypothetical protein